MGILNKKFNGFLNLLNDIILTIGKILESGILFIRALIIKLFSKIKFLKRFKIINFTLFKNIKILLLLFIVFLLIISFFIFNKNYYHSILFYPNKSRNILLGENRKIIKDFTKEGKIKKIVEELLLGPINPELYNIFPLESKLLSARLDDKVLLLNFNNETIMNIEFESENDKIIYSLFLKSIVNSICFQVKDIELVKFYFDGKGYKYLGSYGPIDKGVKPDWEMLK